mmetsp:Transcript_67122/g.135293  ORF Transcript_67122/g.135293 Transcript_67122/m.135293 type:complete len:92 (+) Transcript_67122:72-347(+)
MLVALFIGNGQRKLLTSWPFNAANHLWMAVLAGLLVNTETEIVATLLHLVGAGSNENAKQKTRKAKSSTSDRLSRFRILCPSLFPCHLFLS